MKIYTHVTYLVMSFVCINAIAMEQTITFHKANQTDTLHILKVINEQAIQDHKKIVILPKKFRESAIERDILNNRLYVAREKHSDNIVAFKKLFIIDNESEYNDITNDEIRCFGEKNHFVDAHITNQCSQKTAITPNQIPSFTLHDSVVIYFGGDYTVPTYRNKQINSQLIRYTFEQVKNDIVDAIQTKNLQNIVLLYGLTKFNAGETLNGIDRTPSIIGAFAPFAKKIATQCGKEGSNTLYHSRYQAFMPTFDPEDTECKPLPDDQAIPGYGNVLIFPLTRQQ